MQKDVLRPLHHLNALSKSFPHAWKMVELIRAQRGKEIPVWPSWCFIPISYWRAIASLVLGNGPVDPIIAAEINRLAAIGTWRYTQGVYRFDQDLLAALTETELTGNLPSEVFLRIPEWSVYIETPGLKYHDQMLHGFWVNLDTDIDKDRTILRLLLEMEQELFPLPLLIGSWSLQEAVIMVASEVSLLAKQVGINPPPQSATEVANMTKQLQPLLSLILYLCSEEPDMHSLQGSKSYWPEAKKTRKGMRLFAPNKPTIWRVGETIGHILRLGKADVSSIGNSPRTHIRRAHWHGYWTGSNEQKRFKYNWLSPIVVRGREVIEKKQEQTNL